MKRVLLTTYPEAFLHQGGGEREILLLREALSESGILTDIYGPSSKAINTYDFVIHFSMVRSSESFIQALSKEGRRLILWPNLWFVTPPPGGYIDELSRYLSYFEAVVFRSKTEESHFNQYFKLKGKTIIRASCLISPRFLHREVSDVFRESYGIDRYAIWTGIIEPQKNQLAAIKAFNGMDTKLVISGLVRDQAYFHQCKANAGPNVMFIPPMAFGSDLHISSLDKSDLYVELSLDFPGTSAFEAAAIGCRMLLSQCTWTEEMFGFSCPQVDPSDVLAIKASLMNLLSISNRKKIMYSIPSIEEAVGELVQYLKSS